MESCKCEKTQNNGINLRCKLCKLKHVHNCLSQILQFLKNYLPLANAHTNEFITNNTWENFLPENIRDELSSMCDEQLIDLSSYHKTTKKNEQKVEVDQVEEVLKGDFSVKGNICAGVSNCYIENVKTEKENVTKELLSSGKDFSGRCPQNNLNNDCQNGDFDEGSISVTNSLINSCENNSSCFQEKDHYFPVFSCLYFDQAPKLNGKLKLTRGFPPNWVHKDLISFLREAESNSLEHFNLALSLKEFYSKHSIPVDEDKIFIPHIMNMKKSHEVDVMGDVCYHLANSCGTNLVVDMGSGKGYLSTQLALQYRLVVIGIDAMSVNTDGAQRRAGKLVKHWNGLVRNATEDKIRGYKVKRSKKLKKKLKREALKEEEKESKKGVFSQNPDAPVPQFINEELPDFQNLFDDNCNLEDGVQSPISHMELKNESAVVIPMSETKDKSLSQKILKKEINNKIEHTIDSESNVQLEPWTPDDTNSKIDQNLQFKPKIEETNNLSELTAPSYISSKGIKKPTERSTTRQNEETLEILKTDKMNSTKGHENLYPLTMFVSPDLNLKDIVNLAFEEYDEASRMKCESESGLMLTGLHTCGALGSSILKLFVNNPQAKILCNVACCYHLMEEEFVSAPYDNGEGRIDEEPGFPLSKFLRDRKVGLGRVARNFASQSLIRLANENQLKSKAFPRSLLQKIILDVIGYTREDWKGLRKLDQKCDNMFQYVSKAFAKFGLPTEKLTPELVAWYQEKYKEEERKLAIFHNLKSMVAPCIEAVVILDRVCYLLEQSNVLDVDLVQLFDPMISPRCYGIISYKTQE